LFRTHSTGDTPQSSNPIYKALVTAHERLMANDTDEAESLARQALKDVQADSDRDLIEYALELLNYIWLTNEADQKGIEFFSEFLKLHPDDAIAFHYRGIQLWYSGRPEGAIADYNRSLAVSDYKKSLLSAEPKLPAYKRRLAERRVKELSALGFGGAA
jgi:tetratricopeptide (TPR) repeat protein